MRILLFVVNLEIVNSTMMVFEGEGPAVVCISIDAEIERPVTALVNTLSASAIGMSVHNIFWPL